MKANNLPTALSAARRMPSVKHHTRREFFTGYEVSKEEYMEARKVSAYERYPL